MDVYLLTFIAAAIVVLIVICTALLQAMRKVRVGVVAPQDDGVVQQAGRLRRVGAVRNVRRRMQANVNHRPEENDRQIEQDNGDEGNGDEKAELPDHKIGAKKRAKLAAKAEKKIQREAAEREREERKKREQLLQEERDKRAEKEHVEQLRAEEVEKKAREEKEKQEYEEYLKMKEAFSVEEEGYEQENKECDNLLQEFLAYIKMNKVLVLEDLAAHFGLKTASVVERIQELQANGNLTGVIDDRGKFIYISEDELEAVAKFVRQRGRVSITELAENSNNLINLTPAKNCSVSAS
ncbi:PREDICTED: DDRGK domain-containing protein 1 isoform X1 [Wasmannia auropunctata]|uniref:DDRGK domain-containing protein 1 isoform X1 n=2 Tax=Wasmannia auropunctata TaxID=64793 RepID=UPI0005EE76C5|nr:PREDICTED: DDRGK domain-containing protein 1 isoform X1 [Wasmannia auropunctata]